jgi:hypothetical protein
LQYSNSVGSGHYTSFSSASATASFGALRGRPLPPLIAPPQFGVPKTPEWVVRARQLGGRLALAFAVLAALVAIVAYAAVATWPGSQAPQSRLGTVSSSAGVTGTASTRVSDLNTETFIGGVPFVQQARVLGDASPSLNSPSAFVQAVPQASVGDYIGSVGQQMVLPYLNEAAVLKSDVESWSAAVEQQRQAVIASSAPYVATFQAPAITPGTVIPGAHATFYSCIGNGFCGTMSSGAQVYEGAAACSTNLPFGTRFFLNNDPTRRVFTCMDRGALSATWVDVWFYDIADGWAWQSMLGGTYSDITIVQ